MKNQIKWFKDITTTDELKKAYRELAKLHHPDLGGRVEDMQEINNEYDELIKVLPKRAADGSTYQPREDQRETREQSDAFRAAVIAALKLDGVELEICGSWLWATGNTKDNREALKAAGYKWSKNKNAWYWHEEGYIKHTSKRYTMDEVRLMWGSEKIERKAEEPKQEQRKPEQLRLILQTA